MSHVYTEQLPKLSPASDTPHQTHTTSNNHEDNDQVLEDEAMEDLFSLIAVLRDISSQTGTRSGRGRDATLAGLNNYERLANKTNFSEHQPYFYEIYKKHRSDILKTEQNDHWLENGIFVWYGYHIPSVRSKNIRLSLSIFYSRAKTIKDDLDARDELAEHEDKLRGTTSTAPPSTEDESYYYSDEMLYYLVKLFKHSIRGTRHANDATQLTKMITELGKDLKLEGERPAAANGLDGLLKSIFGFASQCGLKAPDGSDPADALNSINGAEINGAIQSLISNDKFKETISQAVTTIGKSATPTDTNSMVDVLTGLARDMTPILTEVVRAADTIPPPGVIDERTPEQRAKDAQQISETANAVGKVINQLTSGLDLNRESADSTCESYPTTPL